MTNTTRFLWLLCGMVWLPICWHAVECVLLLRWVDKAFYFFGG